MYCIFCFFFFFQAEDGIRDAQESRGLGDVYKRQIQHFAYDTVLQQIIQSAASGAVSGGGAALRVLSCVYGAREFYAVSDRIVTAAKAAILGHSPPIIKNDENCCAIDEGVAAGLIHTEWRALAYQSTITSEDALKREWMERCPNRSDRSRLIMLSQYRFYRVY
eukprot:TRINITY_DN57056_c0_g1_i1.p1 TRINITY_DN57056_c0_g1~~TRINITY_DN57056_c0_g1_i1.p1  ORF type:complete len:164 (+),score=37.06 TRINITY_DN57056_c0_g1_i1:45-536(+)